LLWENNCWSRPARNESVRRVLRVVESRCERVFNTTVSRKDEENLPRREPTTKAENNPTIKSPPRTSLRLELFICWVQTPILLAPLGAHRPSSAINRPVDSRGVRAMRFEPRPLPFSLMYRAWCWSHQDRWTRPNARRALSFRSPPRRPKVKPPLPPSPTPISRSIVRCQKSEGCLSRHACQ